MEVKDVNKIYKSAIFAVFLLLSLFVSAKAHAQTLGVTATGPNTFQITVSNVYNWHVDEYVGGKWVPNLITGGANGTPGTTFTRAAGTYKFQLGNCYNVSNGCSTSNSKSVTLQGSAPAAPTISTSSGYTSITVRWTQPTGTNSFVFTRNGVQVAVSGLSYVDSAAAGGVSYTYAVKGCNTYGECSAAVSASAALAVNPATQTKTTGYTYDALGRLTFVADSANGNRDYDYDKAGNRVNVAVNTASDGASEATAITFPAPVVQFPTLIADCAWRASWTAVPNATQYYVTDTSGGSLNGGNAYYRTTSADIGCPGHNSSANKPKSVKACNDNKVCGPEALFPQ